MRQKPKTHICPKCGKAYKGYPALSRRDNKTEICSECGVKEAMEDYRAHIGAHIGGKANGKIRE